MSDLRPIRGAGLFFAIYATRTPTYAKSSCVALSILLVLIYTSIMCKGRVNIECSKMEILNLFCFLCL